MKSNKAIRENQKKVLAIIQVLASVHDPENHMLNHIISAIILLILVHVLYRQKRRKA